MGVTGILTKTRIQKISGIQVDTECRKRKEEIGIQEETKIQKEPKI